MTTQLVTSAATTRYLSSSATTSGSSSSSVLRVRFFYDYKSPYAYLAKDANYALEQDLPVAERVEIQYLPFSFNMDVSFGLPDVRSEWQWNIIRNAYKDVRRVANRRDPPVTILGPQKAWNSTLAFMASVFVQRQCGVYTGVAAGGSLDVPCTEWYSDSNTTSSTTRASSQAPFLLYHNEIYERFFQRDFDLESFDEIEALVSKSLNSDIADALREFTGGSVIADLKSGHSVVNQNSENSPGARALGRIIEQAACDRVFGVPSWLVEDGSENGELFFGQDRVFMVEDILKELSE
ncbi:unnamed protein product [Polarella glacialis]|uniref:DSBA-like thioredoxin domain-containing protein n=1 Tax=Polarella glacialis TaxID=89957 RepID=A0A813G3A4_POLGL|nr:unnamed protein product [Polarella glacialis]